MPTGGGWSLESGMGQLGQVGQQAPAQVPSLMQMAQGEAFGGLPTNSTPEGEQAAQEYARQLQDYYQLQQASNNPRFQLDTDRQNAFATAGANYTRANNITYEPSSDMDLGIGGGGGYTGGGAGGGSNSGSGFRMGGKPMALSGVQGDVGMQLNRLPPALRDALGPSVVQHIMNVGGGSGARYPGSLSYMLGVPAFEANDAFRLNRDAWGRGFALGSSDMPHPTRPRP